MPKIDDSIPFRPVGFAVIIVSDTREPSTDKSGDLLERRITEAGHRLVSRLIVKDEPEDIRRAVEAAAANPEIAAIITSGGTGFTGRDVTPETVEPLFDKRMDGFSALFHRLSYDVIGTSTIQSRCTAGRIGTTFVFVLPGSPGACRDAWDKILKDQFDIRHRPCNFVEIMPRLAET
ncbi:molybdenum cofactor biosynthesis protein B [Acuticoccus yangtzensis]|uniref:molybdenum cofactor biosynthesis protein B n=1 Tax=Acuticoccus yangtzensis TaxID=1443441 RepID=UPI0009497D7F|nr:molybdenum cofactor biosynthesis protein B [Acuticoccus yangtzensis]